MDIGHCVEIQAQPTSGCMGAGGHLTRAVVLTGSKEQSTGWRLSAMARACGILGEKAVKAGSLHKASCIPSLTRA